MKERGVVKWFDCTKGYGFIAREGKPDVFVHHSCVISAGRGNLKEGERVEFEVRTAKKGPQAEEVRIL